MPISLINEGFGDKFYDLLEETSRQVLIISPFISYSTADRFSKWLEGVTEDVKCIIITRFNREEFIRGASSIEGLERLKQAGADIFALQHLHTKLYVFDNNSAIMGSANFTLKGFFRNHELGMLMENEAAFVEQCSDYFSSLLQQIKQNGEWELTQGKILKEKEYVNKYLSTRGRPSLNEYNIIRWGAVLDKDENEKQSKPNYPTEEYYDILDKAITDTIDYSEKYNTGIWIKFEGTGENRIPNDIVYMKRKETLYEYINRTYYPRQPRSVMKGDIIFMAAVSKDNQGNETPIIVGYAEAGGFDKGNIIEKNDKRYQQWNDRYPYYIEYCNGKFLKAPICEGVTLLKLCNALKHKVYPSTISNEQIPITKILKRHHQKPHIQITQEAKRYLVDKLEELFKQHGYDEV